MSLASAPAAQSFWEQAFRFRASVLEWLLFRVMFTDLLDGSGRVASLDQGVGGAGG